MPRLPPDLLADIRAFLDRTLREGFSPPHQIIQDAAETFAESAEPADLQAAAASLLVEVSAALTAKQRSWPATTDCDRLDAAFDELNRRGIMARHNWTCCQTCGHAEMPDEFHRLGGAIDGIPIRGYTFYHVQDTEAAAQGDGLALAYSATIDDATDEHILAIAHDVVEVLTEHGLITEWNGSLERRIVIRLDWKRRRPPERWVGD